MWCKRRASSPSAGSIGQCRISCIGHCLMQADGQTKSRNRRIARNSISLLIRCFAKIPLVNKIKTCVMHTGYVNCGTVSESAESSQHALVCEKLGCRRETSASHRILVTRGAVLGLWSPSSRDDRSLIFRRWSCHRGRRRDHRCTSSSGLAASFSWCVS